METAILILSALALLMALVALSRTGRAARTAQEARDDSRRRAENLAQEVEQRLQLERRLLLQVARGRKLDDGQILEGRLWRDVPPAEAAALVAAGSVRLLDVRTPQETAAGVVPGAQLIPIDELETRLGEVAREGPPLLVYCAAGGRSAAACELLAGRGFDELLNLDGGCSALLGARARD